MKNELNDQKYEVFKIMENEIVLFETEDKSITLPVQVTADTVWLNRNQLAELFGRDIKTIGKHIGNALKEELEDYNRRIEEVFRKHGDIPKKVYGKGYKAFFLNEN